MENTPQSRFLKEIYELEQSTNANVFSTIVAERTPQIEEELAKAKKKAANMDALFANGEARRIFEKSRLNGLPSFYSEIEEASLKHFGNILESWTAYEIYKYTRKANEEFEAYDGYTDDIEYENETKSEIVEDISQDKRFFTIKGLDCPAVLSNAVVLTNLFQFVRGERWFEMLHSLDLSTKGEHFIYYKTEDKKK